MSGSYAQTGVSTPGDGASSFNSQDFHIGRQVAAVPGGILVQVVACTNTPGQVAPIGQVDVTPLVNQLDGAGNPVQHGTVYGLSYARVQGGKFALIMDPKPGDIGVAVISSRDVSGIKNANPAGNTENAQGNPGSARMNSFSDGFYMFTCLAPTPTQWISATDTGFNIQDVNGNTLTSDASGWHINGALINTSGDVITKAGHDLDTHVHSGVTTGTGDTGPPV